MKRCALLLCLLLAPAALVAEEPAPAAPPAAAPPLAAPALTNDTYATLKSQIAPTADESAWRAVGWRPTFGEAVAEARATQKPIFLWAMNGHPLACV